MTIGVGGIYVDIRGDASGLTTALTGARLSTATAATSMNKSTTSITGGFKSMVAGINPAVVAIGAVTAGMAAAGAAIMSAARIGMEFEQTMKTVLAVSGATSQEYKRLEDAARLMGATTEWSASQSAEALKYLSMAGLEVADSIEALPGMLDLATAAQMDLGSASDIVTDVLTAFGMKTSELTRLSDAFINTSTKSNTTVSMLGESFKYVAPIAAQMGYDVEQTAGYLGVMANAGIKASDAGTDLRQVFLRTAKAARELGLNAGASLNDVLEEMHDRQYSANEVTSLFGMIASKTAMVLMNNVSAVETLTDRIREGSGATKEMASIMRDTLSNAIKTMGSAAQESSIELFKMFSPEMKNLIMSLTAMIKNSSVEFEVFGRAVSGSISLVDKFIKAYDYLNKLPGSWQLTKWIIEANDQWDKSVDSFVSNANRLDEEARGVFTFPVPSNSWILIKEGLAAIGEYEDKLIDVDTQARASWYNIEKSMMSSTDAMREASNKMYDELGFESDQYYAYQKQQYRNDYLKYVGLTGDVTNAKKLLNQRLKTLDEDYATFHDQKNSDYIDSIAVSVQAEIDERVKANGEVKKSFQDTWYQIEKTQMKGTDAAIKNFEKEAAAAKEISEKRAQYTKAMYGDINLKGQEAYDYSTKLLDAQMSEYARYVNDIVLLATWKQEREKEINNKLKLETGTFFDGVMLGYEALKESQRSWAQIGMATFEDFADAGRTALSDSLFAIIKGDIKDLGEIWESALNSMLKSLVDTVADMAASWAATEIFGGVFNTGGATASAGGTIGGAVASSVIGKAVSSVAGSVKDIFTGGAAASTGAGTIASGAGIVGTAVSGIANSVTGLVTGASNAISSVATGVTSAVSKVLVGGASTATSAGTAAAGGTVGSGAAASSLGSFASAALPVAAAAAGIITFMNSDMNPAGGDKTPDVGIFGSGYFTKTEYAGTGGDRGENMTPTTVRDDYKADKYVESYVPADITWSDMDDSAGKDMAASIDSYLGSVFGYLKSTFGVSMQETMDNPYYSVKMDAKNFSLEAFADKVFLSGVSELVSGVPGMSSSVYNGAYFQNNRQQGETLFDTFARVASGISGGTSPATNDPGSKYGFAKGGLIDRLVVPQGEDGFAPVQYGEGVVSKKGMQALDAINDGNIGGSGELVELTRKVVRLLRKFDDEGLLARA